MGFPSPRPAHTLLFSHPQIKKLCRLTMHFSLTSLNTVGGILFPLFSSSAFLKEVSCLLGDFFLGFCWDNTEINRIVYAYGENRSFKKSHLGAVFDLFLYANASDWLATGLSSCQSSSLQRNPFPSFKANQESWGGSRGWAGC